MTGEGLVKVLVTGGAGYIGSHTVRLLCDRGHSVVVLDNLSAGHRAAVDKRASLEIGDIADSSLVRKILRTGIDGVIHFAAWLSVAESMREPIKYWLNNVAGTAHLLSAMREEGVKRIVFSSTAATYGTPNVAKISEDTPQAPINPYGRSKLAMERVIQDCVYAHGLGAVSLRYFNAAGASVDASIGEDHRPEDHLIPVILQAILGLRPEIRIFGDDFPTPDGTCVRDFIHVEDLAEAHLLALQSIQPGSYQAFNVATGTGQSVKEVIRAAEKVTGRKVPAVVAPRRDGDPACLVADPSRIMKALGWKPKFPTVESIIETAWRWHSKCPQGYPE
jgi:UDP-glucose 4-epimerase